MPDYPFYLGATSYVIPGDLVENARFLGEQLAQNAGVLMSTDMQLVLFDLPDGPTNLPDAATVAELAAIATTTGLGYTVHLIRDLDVPASGVGAGALSAAWRAAQDVIARTAALQPRAYVAHLDAAQLRAGGYVQRAAWSQAMAQTLRRVASLTPRGCGPARLAVENLEGYLPDLVDAPVQAGSAARCVDVGHLWLDGYDPLPYLDAAVAPAVIHLHGVGYAPARGRVVDHLALDCTPRAQLDAVCRWLLAREFRGVVTLEVFGPEDFTRSLAAFQAALQRVRA